LAAQLNVSDAASLVIDRPASYSSSPTQGGAFIECQAPPLPSSLQSLLAQGSPGGPGGPKDGVLAELSLVILPAGATLPVLGQVTPFSALAVQGRQGFAVRLQASASSAPTGFASFTLAANSPSSTFALPLVYLPPTHPDIRNARSATASSVRIKQNLLSYT
jgi:hypothetical protein